MQHRSILIIPACLLWLCLNLSPLAAHRDACHSRHSCPSDHGSYVCGDTGICSECPDNAYCLDGQLRGGMQHREEMFVADVIEVTDGDTLSVVHKGNGNTLSLLNKGKKVKIRLNGIDAPEKKQAYGTEAHLHACGLATRQTITVWVGGKDRYGRIIAEVILPDGRSLNHEMVKAGMAWWYRQYAPNDAILAQLEAKAKDEKRGLWSTPDPLAPWEWRKRGRD